MLHIGSITKHKMDEQHKTVVWLSQHLSYDRANIYKIFEQYSVDTECYW